MLRCSGMNLSMLCITKLVLFYRDRVSMDATRFSITMKRDEALSLIPPPPGATSNFEHPEFIGNFVIVSNLVFVIPSTLMFFLRIYTRRTVVGSVDFGDYALAVGWFLSLGYLISTIVWTKHGLGIHAWDLPINQFSLFSKMHIICGAFYCMSTLSVKLSILSFYLRTSSFWRFRACVYAIGILTIAYCFAQMLEFTYSCRPMAKSWDLSITTGSCSGAKEMCVTNSAANAAVDISMLILPIAMLWNVRMRKREKISVIAILMTGSLVCIVSVIRLRFHVDIFSNDDATWVTAKVIPWNVVEVHIGVICACLPHMKPLLRKYFPKAFGTSQEDTPIAPIQLASAESFEHQDIRQVI